MSTQQAAKEHGSAWVKGPVGCEGLVLQRMGAHLAALTQLTSLKVRVHLRVLSTFVCLEVISTFISQTKHIDQLKAMKMMFLIGENVTPLPRYTRLMCSKINVLSAPGSASHPIPFKPSVKLFTPFPLSLSAPTLVCTVGTSSSDHQ